MELYGTCDSLIHELRNKCWGYFSENFGDNPVTLNNPCSFNVPVPEIGTNGGNDASEDRAHAGSTVCPIDLDGDADKDLLLGNLFQDRMIELDEGATPILFDENGDGLMDLLVPNYGYYDPSGNYLGKVGPAAQHRHRHVTRLRLRHGRPCLAEHIRDWSWHAPSLR